MEFDVTKMMFTNGNGTQELLSLPNDEKIAFIDQYTEGRLTKFLEAQDAYRRAIENGEIKCNKGGIPKTISVSAWTERYIKTHGCRGDMYYTGYPNMRIVNYHCLAKNFVCDDVFLNNVCRALSDSFCKKEKEWFEEHDEFTSLNRKLYELLSKNSMGIPCVFSGRHHVRKVSVKSEACEEHAYEEFSIEEMKGLLAIFEEFDRIQKEFKKKARTYLGYPVAD